MFYYLFVSIIYPVRLIVLERQGKCFRITGSSPYVVEKIFRNIFKFVFNTVFVALSLSLDNAFTHVTIRLDKCGIVLKL